MFLSATVHLANNGIWAESKRADVESLIRVTNSDLLPGGRSKLVEQRTFMVSRLRESIIKHNMRINSF